MPSLTQLPMSSSSSPPSPNSPPPLEYESEEQRRMMEDEHAALPPTAYDQRAVPERYSHHGGFVSVPVRAQQASRPITEEDEDCEMKEGTSEEKSEPTRRARPLRPFYLHQWVDVLDTQNTWLECQVIAVDPASSGVTVSPVAAAGNATTDANPAVSPSPTAAAENASGVVARILVHFKGFKSKYDEWLDVSSPSTSDSISRVAPLHTHTRRPNTVAAVRPFTRVGDRVDCKDPLGKWFAATVIGVDSAHDQARIRYDGWGEKFDEWIDADSYRLQPLGQFTQPTVQPAKPDLSSLRPERRHVGHSSRHSAAVPADRLAQFQATHDNESRFRVILRDRLNCCIVDQKEDGNCLFRSVSHQVYGDAAYHHIVRARAVEYIQHEKYFFENFIAGETFAEYTRRMGTDGEWGDNVEIQAMSEIYARPIEIYAYSHIPLKTFTSPSSDPGIVAPARPPPIRLSYHFASHYNSIIDLDRTRRTANCTTLAPGVIESAALERVARLRQLIEEQQSALTSSASAAAASAVPAASLLESRATFSTSQSRLAADPLDFENAVAASLTDMAARDAAALAQAQQQSLREHEEAQIVGAALEDSRREAEERDDREAIRASQQGQAAAPVNDPAGTGSIEEATLRKALAESLVDAPLAASLLDEDEALARALRESAASTGSSGPGATSLPSPGADAEADLQRALASSIAERDAGLPPPVQACVGFGFPLDACVEAWAIIGEPAQASGATAELVIERMMEYLCGQ